MACKDCKEGKKKCGCKTKLVACIGPKGDKGNTGDTGPQGPAGPAGGGLIELKVSFTPTQMRTAFSAPIQVVAAPGAGFALVAEYCEARRTKATTDYTSSGLLITSIQSSAAQLFTSNSFLTAPLVPAFQIAKMTPATVNVNVYENTPLYLQAGIADSVVGDDIITIWLAYRIITL